MLTKSCQRSSSHPLLTFWTNIFTFIHASTFGQSCFLSLLRCVYLPIDTDKRLLQPTLTFFQTEMKILGEMILKKQPKQGGFLELHNL